MIMEKKLESASPDETESIALELAKEAKAGSIYTLSGDLGAGKTVFARGFARGLGIMSPVTSPTFTLVNEYKKGRLPLYHFDVTGWERLKSFTIQVLRIILKMAG